MWILANAKIINWQFIDPSYTESKEKALDILFEISKTNYGIRGAVNVFVNTAAIFGKTDSRSIARVAKDMNVRA